MKIDLLHKPTEYMETVIILQEENGDIDKLEYLPEYLQNAINIVVKQDDFHFKYGSLKSFPFIRSRKRTNIILCGIGNPKELDNDRFRNLIAISVREAIKIEAKEAYLFTGFKNPLSELHFGHMLAEAALLTEYRFNKYLSEPKSSSLQAIHLAMDFKNPHMFNRGV
ncbi:MAG TPA: M17 family peptidase N-terminal domain-containing protein, partial [Candidatus Syntrophosphaera sp.]|nr:M17 family peptidase N-terminal domain-containing protein [Candidatus Syntrophosphaera sp.]